MKKAFRNSKLIVGLWVVITIYPVIITPLHFLFISHYGMSCPVGLADTGHLSFDKAPSHCPICSFDFYWAISTTYKPVLQRFDYLLRFENEQIISFVLALLPLHIQLRAPPCLSF